MPLRLLNNGVVKKALKIIRSDHFQVYWQEIVQLCLDEPEIIVFDNQETLTEN